MYDVAITYESLVCEQRQGTLKCWQWKINNVTTTSLSSTPHPFNAMHFCRSLHLRQAHERTPAHALNHGSCACAHTHAHASARTHKLPESRIRIDPAFTNAVMFNSKGNSLLLKVVRGCNCRHDNHYPCWWKFV